MKCQMSGFPPWLFALCILFIISAAGAYTTYYIHKVPEDFVTNNIVSNGPAAEAPAANVRLNDKDWPEGEFVDIPYNINQIIQQNIGNLSIFPSETNLALASNLEENDKREYSLVSKYVPNSENSKIIRPILAAMAPTDKGTEAENIQCKDKVKVSVREMIRIDGKKSLSEGSEKYSNEYEIKYTNS